MRFRDQIPGSLIEEAGNLDNFLKVLDLLTYYKENQIYSSTYLYRSILCGNTDWLKKRLEDYSFPTVPKDLPKQCMDAMLINARNIMSLKGSDLGLRFFLWSLTFGKIEIDWSGFYPRSKILYLDELVAGRGHLLADNPKDVKDVNSLFNSTDDLGKQKLTIYVESMYAENVSVVKYIKDNLHKFIGFTTEYFELDLQIVKGTYQPFDKAYWYFMNTKYHGGTGEYEEDLGIGQMIIGESFIVR